jgi:hypothetical protein
MSNGILGRRAPELTVPYWIDADGKERPALTLKELGPRFRILFFYQHWCPGCHSHGFPNLIEVIQGIDSKDVAVAVVQTVFEGAHVNTRDKLLVDRERYGLRIPLGYEGLSALGDPPTTVENYRTGGTPWFVLIDPAGIVVHDGFTVVADDVFALIGGTISAS